jgi:two-component system chemotaxis response regulator CheY
MDGISCLKEIMKINPKANVVMMSALGKEDLVKQSLLIGAKGFIVKPLDAAKVSQVLQSVLKK